MSPITIYIASFMLVIWGVAHLFPTRGVILSFGNISQDNKRILAMEWLAEGLALIFLGVLPAVITLRFGLDNPATALVLYLCSGMLLLMALLTLLTGARTPILPMKLCPVIKTLAATGLIMPLWF